MQRVIKYYSGFRSPKLHYRIGAGAFSVLCMDRVGDGRAPGESLWKVDFPCPDGAPVQFYLSDGEARDPRRRYYESAFVYTCVMDGQLFDYLPQVEGSKVAPSEKAYDIHALPKFRSQALERDITYRVYLPRGYRHQSSRRYPVLYMLDGQNIFENNGFGSWQAKESLDRLIGRGQVAELIVVAIDSGSSRHQDYIPPEDGGQADRFARFLAEELKPYIDSVYRTKPNREHTGIIGSSLGGVFSLYTGWKYFHRFGRVGSMSGSWWLENFKNSLAKQRKRPLTVYLDSGDAGVASDCVGQTSQVRDILESIGFRLGQDLHHGIGRWDEHNERAWSRRLPHALRFLFPAA